MIKLGLVYFCQPTCLLITCLCKLDEFMFDQIAQGMESCNDEHHFLLWPGPVIGCCTKVFKQDPWHLNSFHGFYFVQV